MRRSMLWFVLAPALCVIALAAAFQPAHATGVVTNCSNDVEFTQRLGGGGSVTFNCGGANAPATIVLGALKTITQNTTINGGNVITLSGGGATRLFLVDAAAALTLTNITIRDGHYALSDGGAIRNNGTLIIAGSRFYSNTATGNWSGGAIVSYGLMRISNSEFAYNSAANAGALYPRHGAVTYISASSFHHNQTLGTATGWGGALMMWDGPQVTVDGGTTFISNTARAGGAIFVTANSSLTLTNSSVGYNRAITPTGGGVDVMGRAFISNSQVYSNTAVVGGGGINVAPGGLVSIIASRVEYNRAQHPNGQTFGGGIRSLGTLTVSGTTIADNIANVGQSSTWGGGIYHEGGALSLANVVVQRNRSIHGAGIQIAGGSATINGTTFAGNYAALASGDGGGLGIGAGVVTVSGAAFSGNYAAREGGGIYNRGTLTVNDSTLNGNGSYNGGGGILNWFGSTMLINSTLSANTASGGGYGYGGGIMNRTGTVTLVGTTVCGNLAHYDGGGIYNTGTLSLSGSTVCNNITEGGDEIGTAYGGGGIFNGGTANIQSSTLSGNRTLQLDGGGFYNRNGTASVSISTVNGNTAAQDGGGIKNEGGVMTLQNSTVSGNAAAAWGGGILSDHAQTNLLHVTLSGNTAAAGGGIYNLTINPDRRVFLQNTLVANSNSTGANCAQFAGSLDVVSGGFNLSDDNAFNAYCPSFQATDLSNASDNLGPLANHGGLTRTHLPLPGSQALDAIPIGANGCGTTYASDQRQLPRPIDGNGDLIAKCDIGAVEKLLGEKSPWLWLPLIRR